MVCFRVFFYIASCDICVLLPNFVLVFLCSLFFPCLLCLVQQEVIIILLIKKENLHSTLVQTGMDSLKLNDVIKPNFIELFLYWMV